MRIKRVLVVLLVAIASSACGTTSLQAGSPGNDPSSSLRGNPRGHRASLPPAEVAMAVAAARREVAREDAGLASASVTMHPGTVHHSNTGVQCRSGQLLDVKLIGDFPHIVTTGTPASGTGPAPDLTVRAVLLTVDASTGRTCLVSVQTGHPHPRPGATRLHLG